MIGDGPTLRTMSDTITFRHVIDSEAALRELYRLPHAFVTGKVKGDLDPGSIAFIGRSPFVLVGTQGPDGLDVSPRGGAPGFVKVLGPNTLAIPDLSGNNLLDTLTNVVRDGRVGLLFTVPGKDETLRVNGRALVVTDDDVLDRFVDDVRRPKAAIAVAGRPGASSIARRRSGGATCGSRRHGRRSPTPRTAPISSCASRSAVTSAPTRSDRRWRTATYRTWPPSARRAEARRRAREARPALGAAAAAS